MKTELGLGPIAGRGVKGVGIRPAGSLEEGLLEVKELVIVECHLTGQSVTSRGRAGLMLHALA